MDKEIQVVAVDLTPVLNGGANGGAKVFVLELLHYLAKLFPGTKFVLLTQHSSHDELAILDRSNMYRHMVIGPKVSNTLRSILIRIVAKVMPYLPRKLRSLCILVGYKVNSLMKRFGSQNLLRDVGADLLFCPFTSPTFFESGIPTVCTIYDLQYQDYPEFFSAEDVAYRRRSFLDACRKASMLTAISDFSRSTAIKYGNIDSDRIRTIYLRLAKRFLVEEDSNSSITLNRFGLTPQKYLIYPANFWKHKNHEMLLTAFGVACKIGLPADIKLVCSGTPGDRLDWLINSIHQMNLDGRVIFPGYLSNQELADLMENSRGIVFPSLYEGFGLPVIEAMAAGVPVACSNITSLPEIAGDAAILFDPCVPTQIADAIVSLVENESVRKRCIKSGLLRAAEFNDSERMARDYWELFHYAMGNQYSEHNDDNQSEESNTVFQQNELAGIYPDGWIDNRLKVHIRPEEMVRTLVIELFAPKLLQDRSVSLQVSCWNENIGSPYILNRGKKLTISLPIKPEGGCYNISMSSSFNPWKLGFSDDNRQLTVMLQKCRIIYSNSTNVELFPVKVVHES